MSDAQERTVLYSRLQEVLGTESAGTLMSYLPETTQLATHEDIRALGANMEALFGQMAERIDRLDERMERFDERVERFEARMDRFEETMIRFDDRLHDFHHALRDHTRNILFYSVGIMLSVAAGAIALSNYLSSDRLGQIPPSHRYPRRVPVRQEANRAAGWWAR